MDPFDTLLEAINDYRLNHGHFPTVRVSRAFWQDFAHQVAKLSKDGIDIHVVADLKIESSFLLEEPPAAGWPVRNAFDMKRLAELLIAEGKGSWPILQLMEDADVYMSVRLFSIIPGQAPEEGLELHPNFPGAPEGEHHLLLPDPETNQEN